ncbi:PAS domain-containing sensor histidine kinase [Hymenobacter sp. BT188]|uniref:PAS domain-containing sensor histidine kinase n=1 Tax=Hymenobacter sp. BT188 TaxID=2763504 RepID=UPI001650DA6D|nr:PAS domain-containing sensor histidine kinase [Hymenobacter sp. BT188]MBC6608409.1 PAS domain-containing sensor histidine kinase [Hymenobacter sp. BT188]
MPDATQLPTIPESPEAEIRVLREEIRQLREDQAAATAQAAKTHRYQQSQARFRTVFENSPLGQKIITSDLTIRQVNPAILSMMGYSRPDELIGRRILDFSHAHYRDDWKQLQTKLWEHKLPYFVLETCLERADGSTFWCQVTSVLFPDDGGELGYTILEDISERKSLETRLKRLYDAQETILQLATHDIKAPIAHIELLTDLLQREVHSRGGGEPSAPEMSHYLMLIQQACAQASSLLDDVLYVGDLDVHGLQKDSTDLNAYLTAQLEKYRLQAQDKGISLALDLPTEIIHANINPEKFSRVLSNLLGNSLKFTPTGGTVTIGLQMHDTRALLTVQDTGIGIPSKLHAHLFDKFNPTRRAGLHGEITTGLGLFIAKQIVQLHGGEIWLESREQEGTCFFIELPSQ